MSEFTIDRVQQLINIDAGGGPPSEIGLLRQLNRIDRDQEQETLIDRLFGRAETEAKRPLIVVLTGVEADVLPAFPQRIAEFELENLTGSACDYAGLIKWPTLSFRPFVVELFGRLATQKQSKAPRSGEKADLARLIADYGRSLCFTHCVKLETLRKTPAIFAEWAAFFTAECPNPEGQHLLLGVLCIECEDEACALPDEVVQIARTHGMAMMNPSQPIAHDDVLEWVRGYNQSPLLETVPFIPEDLVAEVFGPVATLRFRTIFDRMASRISQIHTSRGQTIKVVLQHDD